MSQAIVFELSDELNVMPVDTLCIYDSFRYLNFINNSNDYVLMFSSLIEENIYKSIKDFVNKNNGVSKNIVKQEYSEVIPVGCIEYTEKFLGKRIKPINIPEKLLEYPDILGREVFYGNMNDLTTKLDKHPRKNWFIKDATGCKKTDTLIINKRSYDKYKNNNESIIRTYENLDKILISEEVDIRAEYRAFVFRERILDVKQYSGNWIIPLNEFLVEKVVKYIGKELQAYTADFAILGNANTVLIEVHNFLSCGLYGFEDPSRLAFMTLAAYRHELKQS